jgi:hypothetical protein
MHGEPETVGQEHVAALSWDSPWMSDEDYEKPLAW